MQALTVVLTRSLANSVYILHCLVEESVPISFRKVKVKKTQSFTKGVLVLFVDGSNIERPN